VHWAEELFAEWATWIKHALPDCICTYKNNPTRIVSKIKEIINKEKVQDKKQAWLKITDMLRAQKCCTNAQQVMGILMVLNKSDRV